MIIKIQHISLLLNKKRVHNSISGLVIFSACSHAGIINVLKDARNKFGHKVPIYGVIGGLHLSGLSNEGKRTQTYDWVLQLLDCIKWHIQWYVKE